MMTGVKGLAVEKRQAATVDVATVVGTPPPPGYRGHPNPAVSHACGTWKPCATRRFMTVRR